jgi:aminopeptidase N
MTLQALRNRVGNTTFFAIMRGWVHGRRGGNGSTRQFIAYAQRLSGQRLARFFHTWVFSTGRPANTTANGLPGRRP